MAHAIIGSFTAEGHFLITFHVQERKRGNEMCGVTAGGSCTGPMQMDIFFLKMWRSSAAICEDP